MSGRQVGVQAYKDPSSAPEIASMALQASPGVGRVSTWPITKPTRTTVAISRPPRPSAIRMMGRARAGGAPSTMRHRRYRSPLSRSLGAAGPVALPETHIDPRRIERPTPSGRSDLHLAPQTRQQRPLLGEREVVPVLLDLLGV